MDQLPHRLLSESSLASSLDIPTDVVAALPKEVVRPVSLPDLFLAHEEDEYFSFEI
jgi:hypothetical protein